MDGRRIFVALFILICLGVLAFSYSSWKQKLAGNSDENTLAEGSLSEIAMMDYESGGFFEEGAENTELTASDLASLSANMDAALAGLLASRFDSGEHVKLLIVGSQAIAQGGDGGTAGNLAGSLATAYKGFVKTDIVSFGGTSLEFMDEMDELINWKTGYDILLLEPFTLNNNGRVVIEDEHRHILQIREQLQGVTDDAVLVLMPSQPIHRPNFYATQIRALEKFTRARGIPYIDHWQGWPDVTDEKLFEYLDENSAPNNLGSEVWTEILREYFLGDY